MVKFIEKSTQNFPLAFFYSVMQSFDQRFGLFDQAYKQSLKSQLTKTVHDLDVERDEYAYVMEQTAKLWATKLSADALNIHGRRAVRADSRRRSGLISTLI